VQYSLLAYLGLRTRPLTCLPHPHAHRYKRLSAKVHPDKLRGVPLAREGFEEVCCAMLCYAILYNAMLCYAIHRNGVL
jgi:hypothetical protein